jgi:glyoxylase I family protein
MSWVLTPYRGIVSPHSSQILWRERELHMSIDIKTPGVHHIALRSTDLQGSKRFYADTLGFKVIMEAENLFLFLAGGTAVGVRGPEAGTPTGDQFNPYRVGLDHIALACEDEAELERVARALAEAGVENTGVKVDETLGKRYVAFKDPDRIAWEFYMV